MNRFLSIILTLILVLSMPVVSVQASVGIGVSIDNPAHSSTIQNTPFDVELSQSGDISEIILELDGKVIEGTRLTESMLTLGEHTLTAYAIGNDGSVESDQSVFNVIKTLSPSTIDNDFQSINSSAEYLNKESVDLGGGVSLTPKISAHTSVVKAIVGSDGTNDIAINATSGKSVSKNKPFIKFAPQPSGSVIESLLKLSFDININAGSKVYFSFSGPDKTTAYLDGSKGYLGSFCPSGTWCHVELTIDIVKDISNMTVSYYNGSVKEVKTAYINKALTAADKTVPVDLGYVNDIRINYEGSANCGLSLDNVKLTEEPTEFTGIKKVAYIYDSVEKEIITPDSKSLDSIKLYMNEPVVTKDISGKVMLNDNNGDLVSFSSAEVSSDGEAIIITPSQKLNANAEYTVKVNLSANYAGDVLATDNSVVNFKTAPASFDVAGLNLTVDGKRIFTLAQINGKKVSADISFSNNEPSPKNIVTVLAVRKNNDKELVSLDIEDTTVAAGDTNCHVMLETDIISGDYTDLTIQIMFLSTLPNGKPVFATREFKY